MKRIIIVGASSGLGNALARVYLERGHRVGVAARRLEALEELSSLFPGKVEVAAIDVTTPQAPSALCNLIERLGGMDTYIHVAGVGKQNPALLDDIERSTVMTNCVGFATMLDMAFNYFRNHPSTGGHIVSITSVASTRGLGMAPSYSASKRFGVTYIEALEQLAHMEQVNVSFTDIRPGFIATDLLDPHNSYPMLMTPAHAVPLIVKAIDSHKRVAIIDSRWWWLVQLWKLIPRPLWVRFNARTHKAQ
ncbi:MAG: SDR family NAD(P)-dependent oxidoreductase [Clostridiales bacterium]|nr:SDR family NAD(P)-dependent oxidoreductase [Clostridiales bacterium]